MTTSRWTALASAIAAAVASGAPLALAAQSWRTIDVARQLVDSAPAAAHVVYGSGTFGLRGTTSPLLYHMQLRYDAERSQPRHAYDPEKRRLEIGVQKSDVRFTGRKEGESKLQVELARSAPFDLSLDLGAVEADLDLTGLRLTRLRLEVGASEARLRFDSLNATRMQNLEVSLGAASFRASRLANANAPTIRVEAGVGNVELDMGGQWTSDIDLRVEVALGLVTIHVPPEVGIRATVEKVVTSFEHEGLVQRGSEWVSANYDSAPRKLRISAKTTLGKLTIDRTGR